MQVKDLQAKIERSLPLLSSQDLARVADFIAGLADQNIAAPNHDQQSNLRLQWVEQLRHNRSQLLGRSEKQTILEMRQEERY